jgi:hypothetical protein
MFYDYRLREYEPAFYFVKLIKRTKKEFDIWNTNKNVFNGSFKDKYHFFVVQVTNYGKYIVTSAMNQGDMPMEWDDISELVPELSELKEIFQPKPLTKEEREKIEKYKKRLSDEEFAKLPYKEKEFYLAVYVKINKPITYEQFRILPEDLKNKYIGFRVGLSNRQFELIKDNKSLLKRYSEITRRKFDEFAKNFDKDITFTKSEQLFIQDKIGDLIVEKGDKLYSDSIDVLLYNSTKKDELIDKIINKKENNLKLNDINVLLKYSSKRDELIKNYINLKGNNLRYLEIEFLLLQSSKKDELIDYYINLKKDRLTDKEVNDIIYLFSKQEKERERIIIKLINTGISKDTINIAIENFNKRQKDENKIQLISELNEQITRIKKMFSII